MGSSYNGELQTTMIREVTLVGIVQPGGKVAACIRTKYLGLSLGRTLFRATFPQMPQ